MAVSFFLAGLLLLQAAAGLAAPTETPDLWEAIIDEESDNGRVSQFRRQVDPILVPQNGAGSLLMIYLITQRQAGYHANYAKQPI